MGKPRRYETYRLGKKRLDNPTTTYVSGNSKYTYRYYPITSDFNLKLPQHIACGFSYKPG